jgi:predicted Zn-dependent peptidase
MTGRWLTLACVATFAVAACTRSTSGGDAASPPSGTARVAPDDDPFGGTAPPDQREQPPPPGLTPDWSFPRIQNAELDNGLALRIVERHELPVVDIQLVVLTGSSADGEKPGLAVVAGELLKAGGAGRWTSRQLYDHSESLGSQISVLTDRDSTKIQMSVLRDHFEDAMEIIAAVASRPRLDYGEFAKLKRREMDRVQSLGRANASWAASKVLYRELYELPTAQHPYSRFDSTADQIDKILLEDCRKWHRSEVTPKNAFLVVTGDVSVDQVAATSKKTLGAWKGDRPQKPSFARPLPAEGIELFLVDRPDSPQAEIYVATLGPERQSDEWPALRATNQILGGGVAGRLFLDVREKRSLAYRTRSSVEGVANGPVPIILSAGTQTAKAGLTLSALLEHFAKIGGAAPSNEEVAIATRYLSDVFLLSVDTVGAIGGLTANLGVLNLPDDYYDRYRKQVKAVTAKDVVSIASRYFTKDGIVVIVAGDAKRLGKPLSHFGTVFVVDPDKAFVTKAKIAHDPTAPIELERIQGT